MCIYNPVIIVRNAMCKDLLHILFKDHIIIWFETPKQRQFDLLQTKDDFEKPPRTIKALVLAS